MTQAKREFTEEYIYRLTNELVSFSNVQPQDYSQFESDLFDLILEIKNVFSKELPQIEDAILIRNGTAQRDANSVLGILKLFLIENNSIDDENKVKSTALLNKKAQIEMKKIFISHRSTDKKIAEILETFLTSCGISFENIFCSSLPGNDIGNLISKEIKEALKHSVLNIVILSKDFYLSPYCHNEAGIIWFQDVDAIVIALPEIDDSSMEGFLDREYKIRRLDNFDDILSICDTVKKIFPEFISLSTKLNANAKKLQSQYNDLLNGHAVDVTTTIEPIELQSEPNNHEIKNAKSKTFEEKISTANIEIQQLFDVVKKFVLELGEDVCIGDAKTYCAFKKIQNFLCIDITSSYIIMFLSLNPRDIEFDSSFMRNVKNIGHLGTGDLELSIDSLELFERAKPLIIQAYQKENKNQRRINKPVELVRVPMANLNID